MLHFLNNQSERRSKSVFMVRIPLLAHDENRRFFQLPLVGKQQVAVRFSFV